jgi:hypothetical protein
MDERDADASTDRTVTALRDLAEHLDVGPAPDVRVAVRARLESAAATARPQWDLRRRVAAAGAALLAALSITVAVSPAARAALVDVLSFAGIELRSDRPPVPLPSPGGVSTAPLPREQTLSLSEASGRAGFEVRAPGAAGPPDRVTVADDGRVVTLVFVGAAADGGDLRLDQFRGGVEPFFAKFVDPAQADEVTVLGSRGLWVRQPHEVAYVGSDGQVQPGTLRLSARTLIWMDDGVTIRLEGAGTRTEALDIAATVR